MMAQVPSWVVDAGILAGVVTAVGTALRVLFGWSLLRWLGRRLVAEPIEESLDRKIDHRIEPALDRIMAELTVNGGSSTKDEVRRCIREIAKLSEEMAEIKGHQLALAADFGEHLAYHDTKENP